MQDPSYGVQANFYIGVHMSDHIASNNRKNWYIVYSVLLGAILLLALAKEIFNATALRGKRVRSISLCSTRYDVGAIMVSRVVYGI